MPFTFNNLGDNFDLREFHDTVLDAGVGTLDVAETLVKDWVIEVKIEKGVQIVSS